VLIIRRNKENLIVLIKLEMLVASFSKVEGAAIDPGKPFRITRIIKALTL